MSAETADPQEARPSGSALLVLPYERREGFWANIRGHVLDVADPDAGRVLAPNPDDLFVASIASELAWTARKILRGGGLPDDVRVAATWRRDAGPATLADINLTITVSRLAEAVDAALAAAVDNSLAVRSLVEPVARISWEAADR